MRMGRVLWGGLAWLWLCQCTTAPSAPTIAAGSGRTAQPAQQQPLPLRDAAADSSSTPRTADAGRSATGDDAEPSAARDAEPSAGRDAEPSAARDAEPSAARDAEPSAGRDAEPAAGSGAQPPASDAGELPAADGGVPSEDSSCLSQSGELNSQGIFKFEASTAQGLKLWLPKLPAGCKAPVVHFANGTGAACAAYLPVLERLASHGFLVVCAETTTTGTGVPGLQALAAVLDLHPELAAHKLGSLGHEAGGQGAMLTLQQAETKWRSRASYAGMAIAPSSGHGSQPPSGSWQDDYAAIRSPMLLMSGTADQLVSERWVGESYELLNDSVEAYWYSGVEATHIPIPHDYIQELAVAWLRWQLLGDNEACAYFKQLPGGERWDELAQQNARDCR